jgi:hypothetical protein
MDERPPRCMLVSVGTKQPAEEQQRQRFGAVAGQRDGTLRSDRQLRRTSDLLDSAPGGHTV